MSRADTVSLLAIDKFAKIMGINPISFTGAIVSGIDTPLVPPGDNCSDIWFQHSWQNKDVVSREDLARELAFSEQEIADYLGYYPAPKWITGELISFNNHYMDYIHGVTGVDNVGRKQKIRLKYANGISIGQRKLTKFGTYDITYSDPDNDSFDELGTITIDTTGMSTFKKRDIKIFFEGMTDDSYEIRYPNKMTLTGNTLTITFDSWMLIDPEYALEYPNSNGEKALDITENDKCVESVDVYLESIDYSLPAVKFHWYSNGVDYYQDGWATFANSEKDFVYIYPALYDNGIWIETSYERVDVPTDIELYYRAGKVSSQYFNNLSSDPLSDDFSQIICWLTVPRLEREFCTCGNLTTLAQALREDYSLNKGFRDMADIGNPFGTRFGEIKAYKHLSKFNRRNKSTGGCAV